MGHEHSNVTFLIPHQFETEDGDEFYGIEIHSMKETAVLMHRFKQQYPSQDIQYFHAEQLIAYYLQEIKKTQLDVITDESPPINIGLGKLCCSTCSVLTNFKRLHLRGNSRVSFPNTVNLFSDTYPSAPQTGSPMPKKPNTAPDPSPIFSPPETKAEVARITSITRGIALSSASMFAGSPISRSCIIESMSAEPFSRDSDEKFNN